MKIIKNPNGHEYVGVIDSSAWQFKYDPPNALRPGAMLPNLQASVDRGIAGIIHRIGNGTNADPSWDLVCRNAEEVGMPLSGYYYFQPNVLSARKAADYVLWWAANHELGLPLMLDCERYSGPTLPPAALAQWKEDWFDYIESGTGVRPILYTGGWWWNPNIGYSGDFSDIDAIISRYPRGSETPPSDLDQWANWIPWNKYPAEPNGIGVYEGWQFTSSGRAIDFGYPADGVPTLDLNLVSLDAFEKWREPFGPPPPPPKPIAPNVSNHVAKQETFELKEQIMGLSYNIVPAKRVLKWEETEVDEGDVITIPAQQGIENPAAYALNVTVIDDDGPGGHFRVANPDGSWPESSAMNSDPNSVASSLLIAPTDGAKSAHLKWYGPSKVKVAVDIIGYYTQDKFKNVDVVTDVVTSSVKVGA